MRTFTPLLQVMNTVSIFTIKTQKEFECRALEIFEFQFQNNSVYQEFCTHLGKSKTNVGQLSDIPFLPIGFFKSKQVVCNNQNGQTQFISSGTTGSKTSTHYVVDIGLYEQSYLTAFEHFYGKIEQYCILALLPSYLERKGSSLIYMVNDLINKSGHADSGFYLDGFTALKNKLVRLDAARTKIMLIGVSFALLDFIEKNQLQLKNTIVMETGGMKGRRKEMIRKELHTELKKGFGVAKIHSEYGMTELLSQAYSRGNGIFEPPPWMKVLIRDPKDPLCFQEVEKTGGINVIDLANVHSCSFIATQDLGKIYANGHFEVLGRFDNSDVRGCNLMVL